MLEVAGECVMALLEKILGGSEYAYRCLVKIHPKAFRAEYENEMVQNFRDLCREQPIARARRGY